MPRAPSVDGTKVSHGVFKRHVYIYMYVYIFLYIYIHVYMCIPIYIHMSLGCPLKLVSVAMFSWRHDMSVYIVVANGITIHVYTMVHAHVFGVSVARY